MDGDFRPSPTLLAKTAIHCAAVVEGLPSLWMCSLCGSARASTLPSHPAVSASTPRRLRRRLQARTFCKLHAGSGEQLGLGAGAGCYAASALDPCRRALLDGAPGLSERRSSCPRPSCASRLMSAAHKSPRRRGRRVSRRERLAVTDEVAQDLSPRASSAPARSARSLPIRPGWIWIDSSGAGRSRKRCVNHPARGTHAACPAVYCP